MEKIQVSQDDVQSYLQENAEAQYTAAPEKATLFVHFIAKKYSKNSFCIPILNEMYLDMIDLSYLNFACCEFTKCTFNIMTNCNFNYAKFLSCRLMDAAATKSTFRGAIFNDCSAPRMKLISADLTDCTFKGGILSDVDFRGANLDGIAFVDSVMIEGIVGDSMLLEGELQNIQSQQQILQHQQKEKEAMLNDEIQHNQLKTLTVFLNQLQSTKQSGSEDLEKVLSNLVNLVETQDANSLTSIQQIQTYQEIIKIVKDPVLTSVLETLESQTASLSNPMPITAWASKDEDDIIAKKLEATLSELKSDMPLLDVTSLTKLIAPLRQQAHIILAEKIFATLATQLRELQSYTLDDIIMSYNLLQADSIEAFMQMVAKFINSLKQQWEDWSARFEAQKAIFIKQLLFSLRNMQIQQFYYKLLKEIDQQIGEVYRQTQTEGRPISCFISYSWGDPLNERRVHTIAADLKQAGIGMLLDIWDNKPGTSISRFTHETQTCDVVLLSGTRRLFYRWSRREGVVSQEIPQIIAREFPPDDRPKRKVIPLLLNGLSPEEVLPSEVIPLETVDLRESYNTQIFHLLGKLYKVQPNTAEDELIKSAQTRFNEFTQSIFSQPLESVILNLGYPGTDQSQMIEVAKKEIDRFEARKAASKKELESILPVLLSKLFDRYNARQKAHNPRHQAFGIEQDNTEDPLPQPLANYLKHFLTSQDTNAHPVMLLKETQDFMGSSNSVEKLLWAFHQADPEHMPVPIFVDFMQMTKEQEFERHMETSSSTLDYLFQMIGYSTEEVNRLKSNYRPVFVFSSYEYLNTLSHAPYIDNHLEQWQHAKVIVVVSDAFLKDQGGSHQTIFSAGKQYASLKLEEGRVIPWTSELNTQYTSLQSAQKVEDEPLTASTITHRDAELLREMALSEAFSKTLKNIKQRLGSRSPKCFISFAKDDEAFIPLVSKLAGHLYQAGIRVLVDIRPPYDPEPVEEPPKPMEYNYWEAQPEETAVEEPTVKGVHDRPSRFLHEMEECDIIILGASQKYLYRFSENFHQVASEMKVIIERSQAPRKGYSSPVLPVVLQGPADPKQFPVMVIPAMLRDYVYVDFRDPRQYFSSVMIVLNSLYQASVFSEVKSCMDQQELEFKTQAEQIKKLESVPLMMLLGYPSPTVSQYRQHKKRYREQLRHLTELVENLVPALFDPLHTAHQKRLQQPELVQGLAYYVPVEAQPLPASSDRHDLLDFYIKPFLGLGTNAGHSSNPSKVLLVQGESGSGKSLALHNLEKYLWETYMLDPVNNPVPILIELKSVEPTVPKEFVKYHLQHVLGLSTSQVESLQTKYKIVFLFDAYDEQPGTPRQLFLDNELHLWKDAKAVVTVRPSYISSLSGYQSILGSRSSDGVITSPTECFVSPFSLKQIGTFLSKFVSDPKNSVVGWTLERYQDTLASLPSLREVVTSPLLLRMVISVLPQIAKKNRQESTPKPVTRAEIYRLFIQQWFEREDVRLLELGSRPKDFDAQASFGEFAENFAFFLFQNGMVEIDVKALSQTGMSQEWQEYFLSQDPVVVQKRAGCPLRQVDQRYSFYHKSFLEYFAMMSLFQSLKLSDEDQFKKVLTDLANNPLNKRSLMADNTGQAIAYFLSDKIIGEPARIQRLLEVVEASKTSAAVSTAASNAVTVLNLAKVSFAKLNWAHVRIPMANLSRSLLVGCNLAGADLSKVSLQDALLADANLTGANMSSVAVGANPEVKCKAGNLAVSSNGKLFAVSTEAAVEVWDMENLTRITSFPAERTWVLFFTKDSAAVVFGLDREQLTVKLIETGEDSSSYTADIEDYYTYNVCVGQPFQWGYQAAQLSPDKRFRVTVPPDNNKVVSVQDPTSPLEYPVILHTLLGHTDQVTRFQFSSNGKFLASWCTTTGFYVCSDHTIRIWDVEGGILVSTVSESKEVNDVKFSPDGKLLIYATQEGVIQFRDFSQITSAKHVGHTSTIYQMVRHKKFLVSAGSDAKSCIWDVATGQLLHSLEKHDWYVNRLDVSPDGKLVATASSLSSTNGFGGQADCNLKIWDMATGALLGRLGHGDGIQDLQFSPSGKHIASAGSYQDRIVRLWDAQVASWTPQPAIVHSWTFNELLESLKFSLDGKFLVVSTEAQLVIYDVGTGAEIHIQPGKITKYALCFNQKKENILIYFGSQHITSFNINTRESNVCPISLDVSYSDVTQHYGLVAVADHSTVQIWDLTQSSLLHTIPLEKVLQIQLNSSATLLAVRFENAIRVFDVQSAKLLDTLPIYQVLGSLFANDDIICSSDSNVITFWQTNDKQSWKIIWTSNPKLHAFNCNLQGVTGLTMSQVTLFNQRGSVGYPVIPEEAVASLGWSAAHLAIANGDFEKLKKIIESGSQSIDAQAKDGSTLLHFATMFQNIEIIRFLLDKGADFNIVNKNNKTPRQLAEELNKEKTLEWIPGANEWSGPLHVAAGSGLLNILKFLVAKGYDLEVKSNGYPDGGTPLHEAAVRNQIEAARILLEAGANVEAKSSDGRTPLLQAAANGYTNFVKFLLDTGKADINAVDNEGKSAVQSALMNYCQETADELLARGAPLPEATFHFVIPYQTQMGEELFLVGSIPELGNWNFADSKTKLSWNEGHIWKTSLKVPFSALPVEYKYVVFNSNTNQTTWEPIQGNRVCKKGSIETTLNDIWGQLN